MSKTDPIPFEITEREGLKVASNGVACVTVLDQSGKLFARRAIKGIALRPPAEFVIPKLNELATELLGNPQTKPEEIRGRLMALAGLINIDGPTRVEWAVVELNGVYVYTDGVNIVVTTNPNMTP